MHRLAHRLIAAEGEGQIGDAARDMRMRQIALDGARRLDEIDAVVFVFLNTCRHGENIGIEDNILRREADGFGQDFIGACRNLDFARQRVGLSGFIKGHHDDSGAVATHFLRVVDEFFFAFLERDRIHHALALKAF